MDDELIVGDPTEFNPIRDIPAPGTPAPDHRRQMARNQRRAMFQMARSLGIDPTDFPQTAEGLGMLWGAIVKKVGGGELVSPGNRTPAIGDPFCVALEARCVDDHEGRGDHRQTAVVKTEHKQVDQAEGERIITYLKKQDPVRFCQAPLEGDRQCGKEIDIFSAHIGRVSEVSVRDGYAMETVG